MYGPYTRRKKAKADRGLERSHGRRRVGGKSQGLDKLEFSVALCIADSTARPASTATQAASCGSRHRGISRRLQWIERLIAAMTMD